MKNETVRRVIGGLQTILLITIFSVLSVYAGGEVDPNFGANLTYSGNGWTRRVLAQPDGKILISGNFVTSR